MQDIAQDHSSSVSSVSGCSVRNAAKSLVMPSYGSADPSLPPAGPLSQDVVSRSADMTLYVVFLPVFPSQSSAAEKIASLIH